MHVHRLRVPAVGLSVSIPTEGPLTSLYLVVSFEATPARDQPWISTAELVLPPSRPSLSPHLWDIMVLVGLGDL